VTGHQWDRPSGADALAEVGRAGWWDDSEYALREYVSPVPSDGMIEQIQARLGYRLPGSYIAVMRRHNGGIPKARCHPAPTPTTWANDHVAVHGMFGIGDALGHSLCGAAGSGFWIDEWGYPPLGVYFADCPSAGHDMIALDFRNCGPQGEPHVVHVDQERDYAVTVLATTFAQFVCGLRSDEVYASS
jgi:hypothetical protein